MSKILMTDRPRGYLWISAARNGMRFHIYSEADSDVFMPVTLCGMNANGHLIDDLTWDEVFSTARVCQTLCCPKCVKAAQEVIPL